MRRCTVAGGSKVGALVPLASFVVHAAFTPVAVKVSLLPSALILFRSMAMGSCMGVPVPIAYCVMHRASRPFPCLLSS